MLIFKSIHEVKMILEKQPRNLVTVFATRIALRTLPDIVEITKGDEKTDAEMIILLSFLALACGLAETIPTVDARYSDLPQNLMAKMQEYDAGRINVHEKSLRTFVETSNVIHRAIAGNLSSQRHFLAFIAGRLVLSSAIDHSPSFALASAIETSTILSYFDSSSFSNKMYDIRDQDLEQIKLRASSEELSSSPLWRDNGIPIELKEKWVFLKKYLIGQNKGWGVWVDWYEDRLVGKSLIETVEIGDPENGQYGRLTLPEDFYDSAMRLNPEIKSILDDYKAHLEETSASITQVPGAYAFSTANGKIQARSLNYSPDNNELAQAAMEELAFIAENAIKTLNANHADDLMSSLVERFLNSLPDKVTDLKSGLLMMQITSLDGFIEAFSHPDNEQEKNLLGALLALRRSADAFQGMFPELQKVQANQLALQLQNTDIGEINKNLNEISIFAKKSDFVGVSAVEALESGSDELSILNEKLDITFNLEQRATLIETQAQVTAHRVVNNRNFFAKALEEVKDVTGGAYGSAKKGLNKGVEGAVSGGVKGGIAFLVGSLVGPLAGLAVLVASFGPIAKKSEEIEDSLEEPFIDT